MLGPAQLDEGVYCCTRNVFDAAVFDCVLKAGAAKLDIQSITIVHDKVLYSLSILYSSDGHGKPSWLLLWLLLRGGQAYWAALGAYWFTSGRYVYRQPPDSERAPL